MTGDPLVQKSVTLKTSSWALLEEAAEYGETTPGKLVDAVLSEYLATDGGEAFRKNETLRQLRKLFGKNQG